MQKDNRYIDIEFYRLWKYVRISRQTKETIKTVLFSGAPSLFNRFASFQHWKNSQIFAKSTNQVAENKPNEISGARNQLPEKLKFAVVLHVFYLDVFNEILTMLLTNKAIDFKLFISCPKELDNDIKETLKNKNLLFDILIVENHGRDILPFLKILPKVFGQNYDLILKIHTKRSNHLNKKDLWSADLFEKLLSKKNMQNALNVFSNHQEIGMIGPAGHILPMDLYYGGNAAKVESLCLRMGLQPKQLAGMNFVAGSMFYARKEVLLSVLNLQLIHSDFDYENKQLDNTMAHTIERTFSGGLIVTGLKLADTNSTINNISCQITKNHPFTI